MECRLLGVNKDPKLLHAYFNCMPEYFNLDLMIPARQHGEHFIFRTVVKHDEKRE